MSDARTKSTQSCSTTNPVDYSDYASGKERVSFTAVDIINDPTLLKSFFGSFELKGHLPFEVTQVLRDIKTNKYIGVIVNGLQCSHEPVDTSPFIEAKWSETRTIMVDYDPNAVNKMLLDGPTMINDPLVSRALYKYYLYDLVTMQVTNMLSLKRDPVIRARLRAAFENATQSSLPSIIKGLADIVKRGSPDFVKIVAAADVARSQKIKLVDAILAEKYSWDDTYIKTYFTESNIALALEETCVRRPLTLVMFPNVYEPCSIGDKKNYCDSNKLIVDCDDSFWASIPKIMAEDLTNEIKKEYLLDRMYYDNIIDEFSYHVGLNESLFIKKK